jgi:hypothetical protein
MQLAALWKSLVRSSRPALRRRARSRPTALGIAAEVLEHRTLLSNPAHEVNLTVVNGDITLHSVDTASHDLTITRVGGNVSFTGGPDGTVITIGSTTLPALAVPIAAVGKITITTNTGIDNYTINDLSTTGDVTLTGTTSGAAKLDVRSTGVDVTIGGAILANFGQEQANLMVESLGTKTMTVDGAVTFKDAGTNQKVMHLGTSSGQVHLASAVTYTDTATVGSDTLEMFGNITVDGKVTFTDTRNTSGAAGVSIHDTADGTVPVLNGALTVNFGRATNNVSLLSGYDDAPIVFNGPVKISSHGGLDEVHIERAVFKSTFTINSPAPAAVFGGQVFINGSEFDGATKITMGGTPIQVLIATDSSFTTSTRFKNTVTMKLTGPGALVVLSHGSGTPKVTFDSTLSLTGGTPKGELSENGPLTLDPAKLKLKKFTGP